MPNLRRFLALVFLCDNQMTIIFSNLEQRNIRGEGFEIIFGDKIFDTFFVLIRMIRYIPFSIRKCFSIKDVRRSPA